MKQISEHLGVKIVRGSGGKYSMGRIILAFITIARTHYGLCHRDGLP